LWSFFDLLRIYYGSITDLLRPSSALAKRLFSKPLAKTVFQSGEQPRAAHQFLLSSN
jgi:hypothetical protein